MKGARREQGEQQGGASREHRPRIVNRALFALISRLIAKNFLSYLHESTLRLWSLCNTMIAAASSGSLSLSASSGISTIDLIPVALASSAKTP